MYFDWIIYNIADKTNCSWKFKIHLFNQQRSSMAAAMFSLLIEQVLELSCYDCAVYYFFLLRHLEYQFHLV